MSCLPKKNNSFSQSGQALLLVLLVMSLVLTLILSSVSRSVTDVEISSYEDNSIRAFDAAQAGIEKAVIGNPNIASTTLDSAATFETNSAPLGEISNKYVYPIRLLSGDYADVFFVKHAKNTDGDYVMSCDDASGTGCVNPTFFSVCWGDPGTPDDESYTPALYLEFYHDPSRGWMTGNYQGVRVATLAYDDNTSRGNNFDSPICLGTCQNACRDYEFGARIEIDDVLGYAPSKGMLLYAKITMLYNTTPQPLALSENGIQLPGQGVAITSQGISGDVHRTLVLSQGYPEIPYEFGSAIYSKTGLTK